MKKFGKKLYKLYFNIGVISIAILALSVCFAVVMRYFFSLSWKELSEFNVTLFAFTTFWGLGINVIENEHVIIDIFYDKIPSRIKKYLTIVDYFIILVVDAVFVIQGIEYTKVAGKQISMGMEIPMKYMYGIMPVGGILCAVCVIYKIFEFIKADSSFFEKTD